MTLRDQCLDPVRYARLALCFHVQVAGIIYHPVLRQNRQGDLINVALTYKIHPARNTILILKTKDTGLNGA